MPSAPSVGSKIDEKDPRRGRLGENGWTALSILGKGQFGVAYLVQAQNEIKSKLADKMKNATGSSSGNLYAVAKMVSLDFLSDKDNQQAGQEVTLLKTLNHPNIVSYYDHYLIQEPLQELVILMEFCEGEESGGGARGRIRSKCIDVVSLQQVVDDY
jgi:serine/threonine protein kinase